MSSVGKTYFSVENHRLVITLLLAGNRVAEIHWRLVNPLGKGPLDEDTVREWRKRSVNCWRLIKRRRGNKTRMMGTHCCNRRIFLWKQGFESAEAGISHKTCYRTRILKIPNKKLFILNWLEASWKCAWCIPRAICRTLINKKPM